MNRMQSQVAAFHERFGHPIGERPAFSRPMLRISLIAEEAGEFCGAVAAVNDTEPTETIYRAFEKGLRSGILSARTDGGLVATADAIADLLYVAIGAAVEFGIDIEPIFDEVHRANMAKVGGGTRGDGKTMKPPGWQPPNVARELAKQTHRFASVTAIGEVSGLVLGYRNRCHCGEEFKDGHALAIHLADEGAI